MPDLLNMLNQNKDFFFMDYLKHQSHSQEFFF